MSHKGKPPNWKPLRVSWKGLLKDDRKDLTDSARKRAVAKGHVLRLNAKGEYL